MLEEGQRLAARRRPPGRPVMHQVWERLLFLHWPLPPDAVRPHVPAGLTLDLFDGRAWVAATPFTLTGLRPVGLPAIPFLSTFHELNARTYVHRDGVPGVWFFSLDAGSRIAVAAARRLYRLPYYAAAIEVAEEDGRVRYRARRTHARSRPARFEADWIPGDPIPESAPGSLEFFLTERYVLFAEGGGSLYRARIHHPPWPLRTATVLTLRSSLLEAASLPTPGVEALAHHARRVDVEVWRLERA